MKEENSNKKDESVKTEGATASTGDDGAGKPSEPATVPAKAYSDLARVTLSLCDVLLLCAPSFSEGSRGAGTVKLAEAIRPKLNSIVFGTKEPTEVAP